jgi:PRD1 phage membrane DNA delivery
MDKVLTGILSVLTMVVGVAIVAVLVSNKAQTGSVLTAGGNAFSSILSAAVAPVTGGTGFSPNGLQLPNLG